MSIQKKNSLLADMGKIKPLLLITALSLAISGCSQTQTVLAEQADSSQWWCYPLPHAKVISPYGGKRHHSGTDIKTKPNDNIYAAFDGEVVFEGNYGGYGNLIRIKHPNGLETYYSHNSKDFVKKGNMVKAGQVIALTGRTGRATTEHLHFETRVNGKAVNSEKFFDHANHTIRLRAFKKTKNGYVKK